MKHFYILLILLIAVTSFADKKEKLWVSVESSTPNEVFLKLDETFSDQKIDNDMYEARAGYLYLSNGGKIKEKIGQDFAIAEDWYAGYKKTDPATGKWVALTQAEKDAVDAANKEAKATELAREASIASLRELVNEKAGINITEQELIDRIDSKL